MGNKRKRTRANGEGWINRRKDGRWDVGLTIHSAKGLERIRTTKTLRKDAEKWLTEQKAKRGLGLSFDASKLSFGEYLEQWLELGVRGAVKDGSYLTHRSHVRCNLIPALGTIKLSKLTGAHFQALYHRLISNGLKPNTVIAIHGTARKALGQAERWDILYSNPAAKAKPPKAEQEKVIPLKREEAIALMAAAKDHRLRAMYTLALATGARHGELLALSWQDITYTSVGADIAIRHTHARTIPKREGGEGFKVGTTKTGKGRVVSVGLKTATALRVHSRLLKEERLACGSGYQESDLVFPRNTGKPLPPRSSNREFRNVARQAGLPESVHFHMLRHTFATVHLLNGTPAKVVQEALGHTTISQTLNTYSHVLPTMQHDAASTLDATLF